MVFVSVVWCGDVLRLMCGLLFDVERCVGC